MLRPPDEAPVALHRLEAGRVNAPADFFDRRTPPALGVVINCGY
jgi:hypothetical protein